MVDLLEARRRILLNTPHLESLSGAMASFETDISAKLKECKIHFTPVQEGTGDPSPDNVRPIHGWDGVTVTRCGKNLVNYIDPENIRLATSATLRCKGNTDYGSISIADGVVMLTRVLEAAGLCFILGELKAGVTYTLSGTLDNTDGKAYIALLDTDIADEYSCTRKFTINFYYGKATFTPEETGVYEVLIWRGGRYTISASNVQLEVGSTATDYEPYTATTLTIPFPQTIYGGYVDLVKGEVVVEFEYIDMKNLNWFQAWNGFIVNRTTAEKFEPYAWPNIACEIYKTVDTVPLHNLARIDDKSITGRAYFKYIGIRDDSISSVEDFMSAVSGHHIAYKLATPITYPLDLVTIRTLKGINNIWSNANGNIEVKFWTH